MDEDNNQQLLGLDEKSLELIGVPKKKPKIKKKKKPSFLRREYKNIGKKAEKLEKTTIGSKFLNKNIIHGLKKVGEVKKVVKSEKAKKLFKGNIFEKKAKDKKVKK